MKLHSVCKRQAKALGALLLLILLSSCDERSGMLPPSGGRLYEVLLVGDRDGAVDSILRQDMPGLPQSEPLFDISTIDSSRFNQSVSGARNIVIVSINPELYTSVRMRCEKDVWAKPQTVVHVNAPSARMLRDSISSIANAVIRELLRAETRKSLDMLKRRRNTKAEKMIKEMFGLEMWVPMDMTASKRADGFLWLSNNSATTMSNIAIYIAPVPEDETIRSNREKSVHHFCERRDSALGRNIKGETDAMQMKTVCPTVVSEASLFRGLWEMTNDEMGGPFVSRMLTHGRQQDKDIVVEGFAYAPGKKKRNVIRQLEAALYTARPLKQGHKDRP